MFEPPGLQGGHRRGVEDVVDEEKGKGMWHVYMISVRVHSPFLAFE